MCQIHILDTCFCSFMAGRHTAYAYACCSAMQPVQPARRISASLAPTELAPYAFIVRRDRGLLARAKTLPKQRHRSVTSSDCLQIQWYMHVEDEHDRFLYRFLTSKLNAYACMCCKIVQAVICACACLLEGEGTKVTLRCWRQ